MGISFHFCKRDICGYEVTSKYIREFLRVDFVSGHLGLRWTLGFKCFLNILMFLGTLEF